MGLRNGRSGLNRDGHTLDAGAFEQSPGHTSPSHVWHRACRDIDREVGVKAVSDWLAASATPEREPVCSRPPPGRLRSTVRVTISGLVVAVASVAVGRLALSVRTSAFAG